MQGLVLFGLFAEKTAATAFRLSFSSGASKARNSPPGRPNEKAVNLHTKE